MRCPACLLETHGSYDVLSRHLFDKVSTTDSNHIMWVNRYVTKKKVEFNEFLVLVRGVFETEDLKGWILKMFIRKFYSEHPHEFLLKMQRPDEKTLLGYAFEHHHFLKQWVRSCSSIIANTDLEDVQHYEIDNIISEWQGTDGKFPSHHELLLRMGESYGASRNEIYNTAPLVPTANATKVWDSICRNFSFVEGMAAMHTLELIANRNIKKYGATISYFDPAILRDGSVTKETVDFLREGYEADVSHSETALDLVVKHSKDLGLQQEVQAVVMRSVEEFDNYLNARLVRGDLVENKQH